MGEPRDDEIYDLMIIRYTVAGLSLAGSLVVIGCYLSFKDL
jgi:hypothetical protein